MNFLHFWPTPGTLLCTRLAYSTYPSKHHCVAVTRIGGEPGWSLWTLIARWRAVAMSLMFAMWRHCRVCDVLGTPLCPLSAPHNCNKTKIKEFYKTCRTLATYLALLDIMQIVFPCSQWQRRGARVSAHRFWCYYLLRRKHYKIAISERYKDRLADTHRPLPPTCFIAVFMAVMRRPTIKEPTIKQKFVLFHFYFTFIAVVWAALSQENGKAVPLEKYMTY